MINHNIRSQTAAHVRRQLYSSRFETAANSCFGDFAVDRLAVRSSHVFVVRSRVFAERNFERDDAPVFATTIAIVVVVVVVVVSSLMMMMLWIYCANFYDSFASIGITVAVVVFLRPGWILMIVFHVPLQRRTHFAIVFVLFISSYGDVYFIPNVGKYVTWIVIIFKKHASCDDPPWSGSLSPVKDFLPREDEIPTSQLIWNQNTDKQLRKDQWFRGYLQKRDFPVNIYTNVSFTA